MKKNIMHDKADVELIPMCIVHCTRQSHKTVEIL